MCIYIYVYINMIFVRSSGRKHIFICVYVLFSSSLYVHVNRFRPNGFSCYVLLPAPILVFVCLLLSISSYCILLHRYVRQSGGWCVFVGLRAEIWLDWPTRHDFRDPASIRSSFITIVCLCVCLSVSLSVCL